jgi:hypothetical protein
MVGECDAFGRGRNARVFLTIPRRGLEFRDRDEGGVGTPRCLDGLTGVGAGAGTVETAPAYVIC